jgi:hypothetical protein
MKDFTSASFITESLKGCVLNHPGCCCMPPLDSTSSKKWLLHGIRVGVYCSERTQTLWHLFSMYFSQTSAYSYPVVYIYTWCKTFQEQGCICKVWSFFIFTMYIQYAIIHQFLFCRIWDSHSGGYEESSYVGYNTSRQVVEDGSGTPTDWG